MMKDMLRGKKIVIVSIVVLVTGTIGFLVADQQGGGSSGAAEPTNIRGLPVYDDKRNLDFPVDLSESEWKDRLTSDQYYVLRQNGTEGAFTGELYDTKEPGTYYSAATGQPLFRSETKYKSGTGWPSFYEPIEEDAVNYVKDRGLFGMAIEVVDSSSGSHLGHVFFDGPDPTGLRYCMNSDALLFVPDGEEPPEIVKEYRRTHGE